MKPFIAIFVILVAWLVVSRYLTEPDVKREEMRQEQFEKGYLAGAKETYEFLNGPGILRDYQLNGIKADKFADMMLMNYQIKKGEQGGKDGR